MPSMASGSKSGSSLSRPTPSPTKGLGLSRLSPFTNLSSASGRALGTYNHFFLWTLYVYKYFYQLDLAYWLTCFCMIFFFSYFFIHVVCHLNLPIVTAAYTKHYFSMILSLGII